MTNDKKWVLYYFGFGASAPVACENTPEELMEKAGIGRPIKWTDQGGRYIGLPFDGDLHAGFYYTINQDGERLYKIQTGQRPEPRRRKSVWGEAIASFARLLDKATR